MAAVFTIHCDGMLRPECHCPVSETWPGLPLDKLLAMIQDAGWRRYGDAWHCAVCAAADTADLEDEA